MVVSAFTGIDYIYQQWIKYTDEKIQPMQNFTKTLKVSNQNTKRDRKWCIWLKAL